MQGGKVVWWSAGLPCMTVRANGISLSVSGIRMSRMPLGAASSRKSGIQLVDRQSKASLDTRRLSSLTEMSAPGRHKEHCIRPFRHSSFIRTSESRTHEKVRRLANLRALQDCVLATFGL